jgi:hemoglobin
MVAALAVTLAACSKAEAPKPEAAAPMMEEKAMASLHDRLGGTDAIRAVVDKFVDRASTDERITNKAVNNRMAQIDLGKLKGYIADQMCQAAGGPCEYTGRDMKSAHAGLNITNAEFDYVVEDLAVTLDEFKVPEQEKNEVLAILAPLRADVVQAPGEAMPSGEMGSSEDMAHGEGEG